MIRMSGLLVDCHPSPSTACSSVITSGDRLRVIVSVEWLGVFLGQAEAQELLQAHAVCTTPRNAALAVDALEVADQQRVEVHARRNGCVTAGLLLLVIPAAAAFDPAAKEASAKGQFSLL